MNDIDFSEMEIGALSVHYVGNRTQDDGLIISEKETTLNGSIKGLLKNYFTKPFKDAQYHNFHHASDLRLNEAYAFTSAIFDDPASIHHNSISLAKHLHNASNHPNIKGGEFYVAYLTDCLVDGERTDAVGLFKSENKDCFIKVNREGVVFELQQEEGININKLDKGCLVFDMEKENGYRIVIVDHTNKSEEALYWKENFLNAKPRQDDFYHTRNYLQMCRDFSVEAFPDADKIDQLSLMNESEKFFKENEVFDKRSFHQQVLHEPEIIDAFEDYQKGYKSRNEFDVFDEFDINPTAIKQMKRVFKSVIKLDKNFHVYVHGNRNLIRKGFDEQSGMNYYQIFFNDES